VCIITYNHEKYLAQALDSVLDQDIEEPYEIVVGEDCSTDGTVRVLEDYAMRFPDQIRPLIRSKNIGRGGRNLAATIAECRGQYIATLEGDDFWISRSKLRTQVEFLDQNRDYSACFAASVTANDQGTITSVQKGDQRDRTIRLRDVLQGKFGTNVSIRSLMFRREAFSGFPAWVQKQKMADKVLTVLLSMHGNILRSGKVLAVHRYHDTGCWTSLTAARQQFYLLRYLTALYYWIEDPLKPDVAIQRRKVRFQLGLSLLVAGQSRRGRRYLRAQICGNDRPGLGFVLYQVFTALKNGVRRKAGEMIRGRSR
jgi:glycosyltransferase involved in cell wall biosynthesis